MAIDNVKLSVLKRMVKSLEKVLPEDKDDLDLTFEYVIGSLYPHIYDNVKAEMSRQHAQGFAEGALNRNEYLLKLANKERDFDKIIIELSEYSDKHRAE